MAAPARYVCLLRGVNLASRNRVSMAKLRETCAQIGCEDVKTYIASGNVVCTWSLGPDALRQRMEAAIKDDFGIQIKVVVLTARELAATVDNQPFKNAEPASLHVVMAAEAIDRESATALASLNYSGEELAVNGRAIYFHLPSGYGRAKLPAVVDRMVKIPTTARNWRTILALRDMTIPS